MLRGECYEDSFTTQRSEKIENPPASNGERFFQSSPPA